MRNRFIVKNRKMKNPSSLGDDSENDISLLAMNVSAFKDRIHSICFANIHNEILVTKFASNYFLVP